MVDWSTLPDNICDGFVPNSVLNYYAYEADDLTAADCGLTVDTFLGGELLLI